MVIDVHSPGLIPGMMYFKACGAVSMLCVACQINGKENIDAGNRLQRVYLDRQQSYVPIVVYCF